MLPKTIQEVHTLLKGKAERAKKKSIAAMLAKDSADEAMYRVEANAYFDAVRAIEEIKGFVSE